MMHRSGDQVLGCCHGNIPCRRLTNQNIVVKLAWRQVAFGSPAETHHRERALYQCLTPDYSEPGVQIPSGFLRKFTPDGNSLLAFSNDQKSVVIYDFFGAGAGQKLYFSGCSEEDIKCQLFDQFFRLRCTVAVSHCAGENLNREFSLFTNDRQYVIVGSSASARPTMYDTFRNNECVSPNQRFPLEDYVLYIVDMKAGVVTDSKNFKCDKIYLSHNQGVSLCKSTLAVLSVQHQTIYLFQVQSGMLFPVQEIGRFCYPDDPIVFSDYYRDEPRSGQPYYPFVEKWYCTLKHRFLCWILRQSEEFCTPSDRMPLANFFQKYEFLSSLRIWKMQLLSPHHLLLKYASEDIVTMKQSDPTSQPAFFAIYDIDTTEILAVYENTSEEFLRIYEAHTDSFRTPVSHKFSQETSSVSSNAHARSLHMKFKQTITHAKYGGRTEATRRLLGQLPICAQSYSSSPYLDLALFSYDDKWVSAMERPKPCGDSPVK